MIEFLLLLITFGICGLGYELKQIRAILVKEHKITAYIRSQGSNY